MVAGAGLAAASGAGPGPYAALSKANPFSNVFGNLAAAFGVQNSNPHSFSSSSPLVLTRLDDRPFFTTSYGYTGQGGGLTSRDASGRAVRTAPVMGTLFQPTGSLHATTPARAALLGFQEAPGAGVQSFAPGALDGYTFGGFEGARLAALGAGSTIRDAVSSAFGGNPFVAPGRSSGSALLPAGGVSLPMLGVGLAAAAFAVYLVARKARR